MAALTRSQVVAQIVHLAQSSEGRPRTAFALHVGGLLARRDPRFVEAMRRGDIVYADGASIVLLAKAAGGRSIERSPTTDLGWDVLRRLSEESGLPPKVSVVGGRPGIAQAALEVLVEAGVARAGVVEHGYHAEWSEVLTRLARAPSDVLIVGLGAPLEMVWTMEHLDRLPAALVLTCGGWLGFLAGEERRAPGLLQRWGLEWAYRLAQDPRRLARRYGFGAWVTAWLWVRARARRR